MKVQHLSADGWVTVDFFFLSVDKYGDCSIGKLLDGFNQLPEHLMPFCHGLDGDFVCLDLSNDNYGKIYYWFHEGYKAECVFLISDDFYSFIMDLEHYRKDNAHSTDKVKSKVTFVTPEFLELLKKSGLNLKSGE